MVSCDAVLNIFLKLLASFSYSFSGRVLKATGGREVYKMEPIFLDRFKTQ